MFWGAEGESSAGQNNVFVLTEGIRSIGVSAEEQSGLEGVYTVRRSETVSYTHLTLPTMAVV